MISIENLKVGYGEKTVIQNLSLSIEQGKVTTILGPNGCGKSTLLKAISNMISPQAGQVLFNHKAIKKMKRKELAKRLCLLSQQNHVPDDMTVEQLVYYGRIPHKKWYERKVKADDEVMNWALKATGLLLHRHEKLGALSGGQRQRAHIAQALAQQPTVLLLDEPTTYLDLSYQLEVMDLVRKVNQKLGITIVMILHELNQASRYSDRLIVMKEGEIISDGTPRKTLTCDLIRQVYGVECQVERDPISNNPRINPIKSVSP